MANDVVNFLQEKVGFDEYPDDFIITEILLNDWQWSAGFEWDLNSFINKTWTFQFINFKRQNKKALIQMDDERFNQIIWNLIRNIFCRCTLHWYSVIYFYWESIPDFGILPSSYSGKAEKSRNRCRWHIPHLHSKPCNTSPSGCRSRWGDDQISFSRSVPLQEQFLFCWCPVFGIKTAVFV